MQKQTVEMLDIADLVLWTENPRDPISPTAKDQDIVDKALDDGRKKWSLAKLASSMGDYYDFSELPTVVKKAGKYLVYDGNRRMILAKIKHQLVSIGGRSPVDLPEIPRIIPCNVCSEKIALQNVYRKHIDSGSWDTLERDIFLAKFMNEKKSDFLILDEDTKIITENPHLNQRFVKEEVLNPESLAALGMDIKNGRLRSVHSDAETSAILTDISQKVKEGKLSTRNNRGKVIESLDPTTQEIIDRNKQNRLHVSRVNFGTPPAITALKVTKRTARKTGEIFGGKLYLRMGTVSNLYRDIADLFEFYKENKKTLSESFSTLIRMALRLLCETASKDLKQKKIDDYIAKYFEEAKKQLDQNMRTTMSAQNVSAGSMAKLLHFGAHEYDTAKNLEQTMIISVILGAMLKLSHGKNESEE